MRLARIRVSNYKRLSDLDINVRGHLVLIGANDVGKTSLLRALNLTLGTTAQLFQSLSTADLRDLEEPLVIQAVFVDFNDGERACFHREIDMDGADGTESLEDR